ncbi:hypothetical protein OROMI_005866 [Orobanche minor]
MLWGLVGSSHEVKVVVRFLEKDLQVFALSLSLGNTIEALLPIKNKGNGTRTQKYVNPILT